MAQATGYTFRTADPDPESDEDRQARLDAEQRAREVRAAERWMAMALRVEAEERAMVLLLSLLTDEERAWHHTHEGRSLRVVGSGGGMYRIGLDVMHGNIMATDEHNCPLGRLCVAPIMVDLDGRPVPTADAWVVQYLATKTDEAHLREVANWSYQRECHRV